MKNKIGYVYKITNNLNGKAYVGVTTQNVKTRWAQHKSDAKNGSECPIHKAIRKYGFENFTIETLETATVEELYKSEVKFISMLHATNSELGYNASKGGESGKLGVKSWNSGKTKENDNRVLQTSLFQLGSHNSFYGKTHSDEQKDKWSRERCGDNHPMYGSKRPEVSERNKNKIWTKEEKDKISKANSKPIKCLQNGITYQSITKACEELKLDPRSVARVLVGKFKQHHGYSFIYADKEK